MYYEDDWPKMPDGSDPNGNELLTLVRDGKSPFRAAWDLNLLIREIEANLDTQVIDIPSIFNGSNNYGFHIKLSNQPDIIARLARGDMNMPNLNGFPITWQAPEVKFEAATYKLLCTEPGIFVSRLIYYHIPVQRPEPRINAPEDIAGRRFLVFERVEGETNASLLTQVVQIRAPLFNFTLPLDFATEWLRERLFEQKPETLPLPVAPTREFSIALFTSKIEATIKNTGDTIGWEDDRETVGPVAFAAKQSLLRFIPHILSADSNVAALYRPVLEHGDFGIHNMTIAKNTNNEPVVNSLFDWETGCIVPAVLSDPLMAVLVDLVTDENAAPSTTSVTKNVTQEERADYTMWAKHYFKILFGRASDYQYVIQAGKDARRLWFALREWRGENPEGYFGDLGAWAERRMKELDMKFEPSK